MDSGIRHVRAAELGEVVREARQDRGLDQALTASLAGVSERFLRELEHGKETVQLRQALAVLDVLGLELAVVPRTARLAELPRDEPGA